MIDALIQGQLHGKARTKTAANGNSFVVAKVRAPTREEAVFVNVIAFDDDAQQALLALDDKDAVGLAGELTPSAWLDKNGEARPSVSLLAHAVISAYSVQRKRKASVDATQRWPAWDAAH